MMEANSLTILQPTPRVIIIDDNKEHLEQLAKGINSYGVACRPIWFDPSSPNDIPQCPLVRVIFSDLHLVPDVPADNLDRIFSVFGSLLEEDIKPIGPYCIILWTEHRKAARKLKRYLRKNLTGVQQPFDIKVLAKSILPSKGDLDNHKLIAKLEKIVAEIPRFDVLFNWESRVLEAAAGTIASLLEMSGTPKRGSNKVLGKLLEDLGTTAAGKKHFEKDPLRAVNEALLPILADRIASIHSQDGDQQAWEKAIKEGDSIPVLPDDTPAKLNKLFHIDESKKTGKWSEPGAVITLPQKFKDKFKNTFGLARKKIAADKFHCEGKAHWVLVQSQAACDYAQMKEGRLPFYLGLLQKAKAKKGTLPAALWTSPLFKWKKQKVFLRVHAGFPISFPKTEPDMGEPIFRLREQILNSMIYELHNHSARPGIMSFRDPDKKLK